MNEKTKPNKEKIIKEIIAALKAGEEYTFYLDEIDDLLGHAEKLKWLGDDLLKVDKNNPLAKTLQNNLAAAYSNLWDAEDKNKEILDLQDEINDDPEMEQDMVDEKEADIEIIETDAGNMIDDAETEL